MHSHPSIGLSTTADQTAMRWCMVALHWGWVAILSFPGNIIGHYPSYAAFQHYGGTGTWLVRSVLIAIVATVGALPVSRSIRAFSTLLQAIWLIFLAVMCGVLWPPQTGVAAYGAFAALAIWLLLRSLRDGH